MSPSSPNRAGIPAIKASVRAELLAARGTRELSERARYDEALVHQLQQWLATVVGDQARPVIAAYVPTADEPGAAAGGGHAFVDSLFNAVNGAKLLLPVCPPGKPQPLRWGYYEGSLRTGRFGLLEPAAAKDAKGPDELSVADAIILPALAADPETGMRLGRGAGYYDRSLSFARRGATLAVVVYDNELRPGLAHNEYDVPADVVITPSRVVRVR